MGKLTNEARDVIWPRANDLRDQANSLINAGDYKKGLEVAGKAGELFEAILGKKNPDYATLLLYEGRAYCYLSQFEKAEAALEEAAQIYRSYYGGKCLYCGRVQRDLGEVYSDRREYVRAEQALRKPRDPGTGMQRTRC